MLLAVLIYGAIVAFSGYRQIGSRLISFRWSAFALALALASANYAFRFAKWQYYLRLLGVSGVGRLDSALVFLSGFVLTVTPGKVGEVFKSAVLERTHGVPMETTAPIVVAERLTDVFAIVLLVSLGSLGFSGGAYWALAGSVAAMGGVAAIAWRAPADTLLLWVGRQPRLSRLVPRLRASLEGLRKLASVRALLLPSALSVVGWSLEGVALRELLAGFELAAPLGACVFFHSTATLAGALVPVPGGLGVAEGILQQQMVQVAGAPVAVATAAMLLIRFATLWWAVIVGFVALALVRLRFPHWADSGGDPGASSALTRRA